MGSEYVEFIMKMQESILFKSLPENTDRHAELRKKGADLLGETVSQLVTLLRPEIVLEIGAHEAKFSRSMKSQLPQSRVVAFEANPTVYKKFEHDVVGHGVEFLFQCVADDNRTYEFSVPGTDRAHPTMGSVLKYTQKDVFATYQVPGVRLDTFLNGAKSSNAMWIDVEGAVGSVLAGASDTLDNCVLLFAELEARERWEGQMLDSDVIRTLLARGLVPVLRDIQRHKWQHNVLFLREKSLLQPKIRDICFNYLQQAVLL
ncbi:MAG: FkbM family methyltransferase [Methylobacterium frigidaeris]